MKLKVLHRHDEDYQKPGVRGDVERLSRNPDPMLHPFERAREYTRAVNAVKIERMFAKPFVKALDGHVDSVRCLSRAHKKPTVLISGGCDGELRFWDLAHLTLRHKVAAHQGFVRGVCMSADDRFAFSV